MITLNSKNYNTFYEILENFLQILNYGNLECPHCHSHNLEKWGFYHRWIIFFYNRKLKEEYIKIQRVRCKSCGKTHALLPLGVIPYKQFSAEVIINIINDLLYENVGEVSEKNGISENTIINWFKEFKKNHLSRLITTFKCNNIKNIFYQFKNNINEYIKKFFLKNNYWFMQKKLGYMIITPS